MNDSKRNCTSVKCKCKNRVIFSRDEVELNEVGQRVIVCSKCNREIVLRKK